MKAPIIIIGLLLTSAAMADSRCIVIEHSNLKNKCETCAEVTVHELRPPAEQAAGLFSGTSRKIRLEPGASETLGGTQSWIIGDIGACH
jgi:hypothetical protein